MEETMERVVVAVVLCLAVLRTPVAAGEAPTAAPTPPRVQTRESQAAMTPSAALAELKAGNARFVANATKRRDWSATVVATAQGQYPFAAVLGCMDSRVPIEVVFDQGIGDVFGVRVAGNVVNADELGSLEYAVSVGTKLIVVLGHTGCGAVKGALGDVQLGNLTGLLAKIHPAVEAAHCSSSKDAACVTKVAAQNVRQSLKEIRDGSPYLAKQLDEGKIALVGAMYDVAAGRVAFLEN
jgi:carbonic anhydrase